MAGNPYARLASLFVGKTASTGLVLGKVLSAPSKEFPADLLRVSVGGTVQDPEDLLKNSALGELDFLAGDRVLLLPIEEAQRYIILCKVVGV